jgi:hypothetical protein
MTIAIWILLNAPKKAPTINSGYSDCRKVKWVTAPRPLQLPHSGFIVAFYLLFSSRKYSVMFTGPYAEKPEEFSGIAQRSQVNDAN